MVTNKILSDCIAKKISAANSDDETQECILALEKAGENPPEHSKDHVKRVLSSESRKTLSGLIPLIQLIDGTQSSAGVELRKKTISHLQLPSWSVAQADSILNELLGWLHDTILKAWQENQHGWIERDHFINQLHSILSSRRRQSQRERAENLIPVTDISIGQEKGRPFVKQLHLITDDGTIVDNAIREFIRCNIEKLRLSQEGNIIDDDWIAFESTLLARWKKIYPRVMRMHSSSEERDIGFIILTETTESHREKLAGAETEQVYLTSGTYHRMADRLHVGWHPRYETLMNELPKKA